MCLNRECHAVGRRAASLLLHLLVVIVFFFDDAVIDFCGGAACDNPALKPICLQDGQADG